MLAALGLISTLEQVPSLWYIGDRTLPISHGLIVDFYTHTQNKNNKETVTYPVENKHQRKKESK